MAYDTLMSERGRGKSGLSLAARRRFLREGLKFAAGARRVIRRKMAGGFSIDVKKDKSYVTDADLAAERYLRAAIAKIFPDHGVLGEEFPRVNEGADFQWIVDPIDGTLSFSRGIPLFGVIIALHYRGRPVVGIIDHPALGLRFHAGDGLGAFCNGRRVRVDDGRRNWPVFSEVVATGDRGHFIKAGKQGAFARLTRLHPQVRTYADCFGHTLAARGAVGAMVDFGVRIWDIAATELLIREAGGKYVCVQTVERPDGTLYGIIFGKAKVVDWLVPLFR